MTQTDTPTKAKTQLELEPKLNIQEPKMFKVIFINDEITTMEFIIESLRSVFDYDEEDAQHLTMRIHEDGSGVVAVYPYEIAEQKGIEVTILARNHGFPLQVKLEPEA
jgi:ATP-dependent Clp protease adaptor protein ClpS